jgi:hypothetical protein
VITQDGRAVLEEDFPDHGEQIRQDAIGNEHPPLVNMAALKNEVTLLP